MAGGGLMEIGSIPHNYFSLNRQHILINMSIDNLELLSGSEHRRKHLKDNVHKRWIGDQSRSIAL